MQQVVQGEQAVFPVDFARKERLLCIKASF
jgi:hypothetical protein